ncbi:MAG: hypothetical protein ACRD52_01715 [Candidatus Acidiferrales bacterium]
MIRSIPAPSTFSPLSDSRRRAFARIFFAAILFFAAACVSFAGTVSGTVRNGTTGKPSVGTEVILIQLQGGMQPVATTKTDSQGHFQFTNPGLGQAPMLIRAVYHGVLYHQPVPPGTATADVQVFDPTDKPSAVTVPVRAIFLQPSGSTLLLGDEYTIDNKTQPPLSYYRSDGSFRFSLPDGAQLHDISAQGPEGMPVIQSAIDKGHQQSAIAFAFRPGESGVRISYNVPYPDNHATLRFTSPYTVDRVALLAQPSVQVTADGFVPAGSDQGFNVYVRDAVAAGVPLSITVSGTAPPPPQNAGGAEAGPGADAGGAADNSGNPSVNSRLDAAGAESPTAAATTLPARLDSLKWILVAGFAAIFVLGFVYLWLRPQEAVAAAAGGASIAVASPGASSSVRAAALAEVEHAVKGGLDELKDNLFRLELRHQAGTISEEDYARERQRMEKTLRDFVRG